MPKTGGSEDEFADLGGTERLEAEHRRKAFDAFLMMNAHIHGMYRRMDMKMPVKLANALMLVEAHILGRVEDS